MEETKLPLYNKKLKYGCQVTSKIDSSGDCVVNFRIGGFVLTENTDRPNEIRAVFEMRSNPGDSSKKWRNALRASRAKEKQISSQGNHHWIAGESASLRH